MNTEIFSQSTDISSGLGQRIKRVRIFHKMTQKTFAAALGIAQGFLCSIERGKKTPSETLIIALQHRFNISDEWLQSGTGELLQNVAKAREYAIGVPLYKSPPRGISTTSVSDIECHISLPGLPENCFAYEYSGDFMSPTVRDGDLIIINPDKAPKSGDIVLFVGKWGESFLRRFRSVGEETFFSADNSSYATFKPSTGTELIGIVESVWRKIKI